MILHIPHSSTRITEDIRKTILLSDHELDAELLLMTDAFTDDLFSCDIAGTQRIIYPVSRLVVDPERFINDEEEPMSKKGMGVIYTRTSTGAALRLSPSEKEREKLLEQYYHPHHERFTEAVRRELENIGRALIIDCHSFSSVPLPHEPDQSPDRPDICIGTDEYHTSELLADAAVDLFRNEAFSVALNKPFGGTIVPMGYYRKERKALSILIEINRKLYMNEKTGMKNGNYGSVKTKIQKVLKGIVKGFK